MKRIPRLQPEYLPLILMGTLFCAGMFLIPGLHQPWLMPSILKNSAYHGIIALGLMPVLISGEVDMSIGAQMTFYNVLCAAFLKGGLSVSTAILLTLGVAVFVGCLQGAAIARWRLSSILVTLATTMFLLGISSALNRGVTIYNLPKGLTALGDVQVLGLTMPTLVWFLAAALMGLILARTYWGRFFFAVGYNETAADKGGVPILQTKMVAFALTSMFCAFSGIIYISQLGFAPLSNGQDVMHSALTIAALGGVSFTGGRGRVPLVLLGGLMVGALTAFFSVIQVPVYYQNCIKGIILFAAIFTNISKS